MPTFIDSTMKRELSYPPLDRGSVKVERLAIVSLQTKQRKSDMMTRKSIGIPVDAPKNTCSDHRCAWHGTLSVRGRTFTGTVTKSKARDTVVVEWGYTQLIPKYERYERRKSRVVAHNPECLKARDGDTVIIAECRPLSKTKSFVVVGVPKRKIEKPEFKVAEIEEKAVAEARKKEAKEKKAEKPEPKGEKKTEKKKK